MVANHLSRLPSSSSSNVSLPLDDSFPDEQLFMIHRGPWYANIVNYLVTERMPSEWSIQDKRRFLSEVRHFYFDDPYLFKYCSDQLIQRCILDDEFSSVLIFCHMGACGGHFSTKKTVAKILQSGFY